MGQCWKRSTQYGFRMGVKLGFWVGCKKDYFDFGETITLKCPTRSRCGVSRGLSCKTLRMYRTFRTPATEGLPSLPAGPCFRTINFSPNIFTRKVNLTSVPFSTFSLTYSHCQLQDYRLHSSPAIDSAVTYVHR